MINKQLYTTIGLGGTFDHFHDGHADFLNFASQISKNLVIGVTNQHMVLSKPYAHLIEPLHIRKQRVTAYCHKQGISAEVITLDDPYGPTLENTKIEAIACTTDTSKGAEKINEVRNKLHLKELPIHIHSLKNDLLGEGPINATRIRAGEIDTVGHVFASLFKQELVLTPEQKSFFSNPQGKMIESPKTVSNQNEVFVVGDSTLETFLKNNWRFSLGVFDKKRHRKLVTSQLIDQLPTTHRVNNVAGEISVELVTALQNWFTQSKFKFLFVDGEEDLAAVVLVLISPLETVIYYGQPDKGVIEMKVTIELKQRFYTQLLPAVA